MPLGELMVILIVYTCVQEYLQMVQDLLQVVDGGLK